ncbi:beta-galactosidase-like isoform X2 [Lytechinus pictus]|uniref:beta-galactosidase-like isoform X2 n=1 Tax=Lytechinus pictus TaxID=7653 RepID=UPI0030BA01FB
MGGFKAYISKLLVCMAVLAVKQALPERSFTIDYDNNTFLKDGQPFRYVSGSFHYSRVPAFYWQDRLMKMKMAGLNAVQTYVIWNFHELKPGTFNFEGDHDIVSFLKKANDTGLAVILRAGPYICGEWDLGGLPAWLLDIPGLVLRSSNDFYMAHVTQWMNYFLPKVKPYLYANGGPVIMVQVENEYGSYKTCDHAYQRELYHLFRKNLGPDVVLFTTDGPNDHMLQCGSLQDMYATIDFGSGSNLTAVFQEMRKFEPKGPLVNSEFYTGGIDHWGRKHTTVDTSKICSSLDKILALDANVNMYMFEGGTNFGFWNGANYGGNMYNSQPTTYDYDAPLTEAGDPTPKYMAIRNVIGKHLPLPPGPIPPPTKKYPYGVVDMAFTATIYDVLDQLSPYGPIYADYPITMETMKQYQGFMLYRTQLMHNYTTPTNLTIEGIRDRGYIIVDQVWVGTLNRNNATSINITGIEGMTLDILVENQGHINYGSGMLDPKGIISNVTLDDTILAKWSIYSLDLDNVLPKLQALRLQQSRKTGNFIQERAPHCKDGGYVPSFYLGSFPDLTAVDPPQDTFLKTSGWTKGQAFMNDFNLGRYWPLAGPQITLFVPSNLIKPSPAKNTVFLLELERPPCLNQTDPCTVEFIDRPIINATVSSDLDDAFGNNIYEGHAFTEI